MCNNHNLPDESALTNSYRKELEKPLDEIKEDIFFRADHFQNESWYEDFLMLTRIGVCQPDIKYVLKVQKALKIIGYHTHQKEQKGKLYVVSGIKQNKIMPKEQNIKLHKR